MRSTRYAANDSTFITHSRNTLAIPATVTLVQGYPDKLKIYLTYGSSFWQVRCFHGGRTHRRNLKTLQKSRATTLAKEFFNELMAQSYNNKLSELKIKMRLPKKYSFRELSEQMLTQENIKVLRGEMAKHSHTMLVSRLKKHVIPYFREKDISKIDGQQIFEFFNYLNSLNLSTITISQYLIALRKVFNHAFTKDLIPKVPIMPKIKNNSIPRGGFTVREYWKLMRSAKLLGNIEEVRKVPTHRNRAGGIFTATETVPFEFSWLIGFMVNSFVRPVDIKLIQHKHIEVIRGENIYLRLTLPETKRHRAQVVTLRPAVRIYEALKKHMAKKALAAADDYLFLPEIKDREAAMYLISKSFRKILECTNLRKGNLGQNRTIYSLRHTAITFRLLYGKGIDLLTLARNARTSVEMIERFYASNLTAEMNIEMLQSRR